MAPVRPAITQVLVLHDERVRVASFANSEAFVLCLLRCCMSWPRTGTCPRLPATATAHVVAVRARAQGLVGATAYGPDGEKIGRAGQVFLDDSTGQPEWVTVSTGLFAARESFVPLADARLEGSDLRVPFGKDQIKDAPNVDVDAGHLSEAEERDLYRHYGLEYDTVGGDTSGPSTDDAMTRSEERLRTGTEKVETGRARLRKYIVTEDQTVTVPVSKEQVRVEREPITEANVGDAMSGAELSEEEHEVVLHEERPIVAKEAVPVERVRLDTDVVTGQEQFSEQVRKEVIETEGLDQGDLPDRDRR